MLILIKRLEDIQHEQAYLKKLRSQPETDSDRDNDDLNTASELKELEQRIAEDPSDAARFYHQIANLTRTEFKSIQKKYSQLVDSSASERENLNSELETLQKTKQELESRAQKATKGTKLVICLQNYVRKMLQERLEESARQLEQLGVQTRATKAEADEYRSKAAQLE